MQGIALLCSCKSFSEVEAVELHTAFTYGTIQKVQSPEGSLSQILTIDSFICLSYDCLLIEESAWLC